MSETPEFVVDIEPGSGSTVRLCVQARGLVPIEDEVERALPSFPLADLDELRSGDASEQVTAIFVPCCLARRIASRMAVWPVSGLAKT